MSNTHAFYVYISLLFPCLFQIVGAVRSSADTIQVTFYVTDVRISSVVPQEEVIAALNAVANSRLDEVTGFDVSAHDLSDLLLKLCTEYTNNVLPKYLKACRLNMPSLLNFNTICRK